MKLAVNDLGAGADRGRMPDGPVALGETGVSHRRPGSDGAGRLPTWGEWLSAAVRPGNPELVGLALARRFMHADLDQPTKQDSGRGVQMVVGCGAWITALCIIGALAALLANAGGVGLLALSVLLALAAAGLRQLTAHPVARQVGATLVLSAYGVGLFGVGDLIRSGTPMQLLPVLTAFSWAFLGAAVLGYPSPQIHTVLGLGSLGFTAAWLHAIDRLLPHLLLVVALWVAIALQLHRGGQQIGALARILAVAWLAVHLLVVALDARDTGRAVFDAVACSIALVWVLVYLQRAYGWSKHWPVIVAGEAVAALTLGIVLHPGVVAGVMLLVIGLSFNDRSLSVGGGVLLAATLIQAYYSLHLTLLTKSLALMAAGVVLLGARGLLPAAPAGSRSRLPTMEVQT